MGGIKTSESSAAEIGGKVQLVVFFDCKGMIYQHIRPTQQRINNEYYITVIKRLLSHAQKISRAGRQLNPPSG